MSRIVSRNLEVTHPAGRPGAKDPTVVMTRDQFGDVDNPYREATHLPNDTVCSECGAVVRNQRWVRDPEASELLLSCGAPGETVCPACRKSADRLPGGILTLRGAFWPEHRTEILHLVRNEEAEALQDNPLERVLSIREEAGSLVVETTNPKLAQRLGRSLEKAYRGTVEYQWPDRNQLARVNWTRD